MRVLTATRLVVEARGHEEALLGCSRCQSPLIRRKDRNHQRRELALDLLIKQGEEEGGEEGRWERRRGRKGGKGEETMSTFGIHHSQPCIENSVMLKIRC